MLDLEAINELPQVEAAPSADDIRPDDMTVYITEVLTPYFEHIKSKGNLLRQGKSFDNWDDQHSGLATKQHKLFGHECKYAGLVNNQDKAHGKGFCKSLSDDSLVYSGTFVNDEAHGVSKSYFWWNNDSLTYISDPKRGQYRKNIRLWVQSRQAARQINCVPLVSSHKSLTYISLP